MTSSPVIYSAKSVLSSFSQFKSLFAWNGRQIWYLSKQLAIRDIKARYRQTMLGFLWLFIPVFITTGVFVFMNQFQIINPGETAIPYFLYAFTGTMLWQVFVDAVIMPMTVFTQSKQMIAKIQFPKEALIFSAAIAVFIQFALRMIVVLPIVFFYGYGLTPALAAFPVVIVALVGIGLLIGLILAPLNLLYNDVLLAVQSLLTLLVFTVPAGFAAPAGSPLDCIMDLNPLSFLIDTGRNWLTTGDGLSAGALTYLGALIISFSILYMLGFLLIRIMLPIITERLSA